MKLTPRLYLVGYVGLVAVWYFFAYHPLALKQGHAETSIMTASAQLSDFEQTVAKLPVYLASKKDLRYRLDELNSKLYSKRDVLTLFERIKTTANQHGLKTTEIVPPVEEMLALNNQAPNPDEPQFLNITLYLRGDFLSFGRFCQVLEQQAYFRGTNSFLVTRQLGELPVIQYGFKALLGTGSEHD